VTTHGSKSDLAVETTACASVWGTQPLLVVEWRAHSSEQGDDRLVIFCTRHPRRRIDTTYNNNNAPSAKPDRDFSARRILIRIASNQWGVQSDPMHRTNPGHDVAMRARTPRSET